MAIHTSGSGLHQRQTAMVFMCGVTVIDMKGSGERACVMGTAVTSLQMEINILGSTGTATRTDMGSISGLTEMFTLGSS